MDRNSQATLAIGAILLLVAVASPYTFPALLGNDFEGFIYGLCFFGVFFIVGLVVLIVGLTRGDRRQQQQQQQVVVVGAGSVGAPSTQSMARVKCPTCARLNPVAARFCTQCATYLGGQKA